jgi:hypothetical protein
MADAPFTRAELVKIAEKVRVQIQHHLDELTHLGTLPESELTTWQIERHTSELVPWNTLYTEFGAEMLAIMFDGEHNTPKLTRAILGDYHSATTRACVDCVFELARLEGFTPETGKELVSALCLCNHKQENRCHQDSRQRRS